MFHLSGAFFKEGLQEKINHFQTCTLILHKLVTEKIIFGSFMQFLNGGLDILFLCIPYGNEKGIPYKCLLRQSILYLLGDLV